MSTSQKAAAAAGGNNDENEVDAADDTAAAAGTGTDATAASNPTAAKTPKTAGAAASSTAARGKKKARVGGLSPDGLPRPDEISPNMTMRSGRKKKRPRAGDGGTSKAEEETQTQTAEEEEEGGDGEGAKIPAAKRKRGGGDDAPGGGGGEGEEDVVMVEEEAKVAEVEVAVAEEEVAVVGGSSQPAATAVTATAAVGRVALSLPSETATAATVAMTETTATARRGSPVRAALDGARSGGRRLVSMFAAGGRTTETETASSSTTVVATTTTTTLTTMAAAEVSTVAAASSSSGTAAAKAGDATPRPPAPGGGGSRLLQSLSRVYPTPIRPSVMSYLDRFSGNRGRGGGGDGGDAPVAPAGGGDAAPNVNGGRPPSPPPMVVEEEGRSPGKGRARVHAILSNPYLWTGLFLTAFVVSSRLGLVGHNKSISERVGEASAGLGGPGGYYGNLLGRYRDHEVTQPVADPGVVPNVELVAEEEEEAGSQEEETIPPPQEGGGEEEEDGAAAAPEDDGTEDESHPPLEEEEEPADTSGAAANRTAEIRAEILRIRNERLLERYDADLRLLGRLRPTLDAMVVQSEMDGEDEDTGGGDDVAAEMDALRSDLDRRGDDLGAWEDRLVRAEAALSGDLTSEGEIRAARDALRDLAAVSPVELLSLADASAAVGDGEDDGVSIRLPSTGENCSDGALAATSDGLNDSRKGGEQSSPSSFIAEEDVAAAEDKMRDLAESTAGKVEGDGERVREWARREIEDARVRVLDEASDDDDAEDDGDEDGHSDDDDAATATGLSRERVEEEIRNRLDVEDADRTGRVDFASARRGATVVATRTSPSYVDMLPVFNRVMARLGLRFYGHPPAVALSVTDPPDALGQCWAFRRDPVLPPTNRAVREGGGGGGDDAADGDDDYHHPASSTSPGRLAGLTVRLARPVKVNSVVVEHPLGVEGANPKSAIREFRVLGYEGDDGEGNPWLLGSFTYDIYAPRSLQEFAVARTDVDGRDVPHIKSVTLAVDSNWGYDYSCLYRFRVHGTP